MANALDKDTRMRTERRSGEDAAGTVSGAAESLTSRAAEVLKGTATDFAESRKREGAERIKGFGRAVHGAADEIGKEIPQAAEYVHQAADTIEGAPDPFRNPHIHKL